MNFYENVCDQQTFNSSTLISCTTEYLCFIKISNGNENPDHSWEDQYLDHSQINRGLINQLKNKDFDFTQANFDDQSTVV